MKKMNVITTNRKRRGIENIPMLLKCWFADRHLKKNRKATNSIPILLFQQIKCNVLANCFLQEKNNRYD